MGLTVVQNNELVNNGITKYKNLFNEEEINLLKQIVKSYSGNKANQDIKFATNLTGFLIKLIKGDFTKIKQSLSLISLSKRKKLDEISDSFFKEKSYLNMIDGYSSPISDQNVFGWHCDHSYHNRDKIKKLKHPKNRQLKFFIYLTAVQSDNGCMCFIPKSHKIVYALKMGILENKIEYQKFQWLKDLRKVISQKNNYSYIKDFLKDEKDIIDNFLRDTKFIENDSDTNLYDYDMSPGDAIIFDENGIHKGSKILKSERTVLRFLFSPNPKN